MLPDDPVTITYADAMNIRRMWQWYSSFPKNTPQYAPQDFSNAGGEQLAWFKLSSPGYRGISTTVNAQMVYLDQNDLTTWRNVQNGYSPGNGGGDLSALPVRFDFGSGFYYSTTVVCCRFNSGKWFVVSPGDSEVHVTLNGNMTGKGAVSATVLKSDGVTTDGTLTVQPAFNLSTTVNSGTECVVMQRANLWEAVLIPCPTS